MTTILPEKNKKELKMDYFVNFVKVFVWMVFFVCLVFIILQIAIYTSIKIEKDQILKMSENFDHKQKSSLILEYKKELSEVDKILDKISVDKKNISETINFIFDMKQDVVSINSMSIDSFEEYNSVTISGFSTSRDDLLAFSQYLEKSKNISDFSLPLSSFTKNRETPFSLTFKYKKYE